MKSYRRFITPLAPTGGASVATSFVPLMLERLRSKQRARQKTALGDWEDEGGSVAKAAAAAP